ncbi:MAG TPA: glutamate--tRNA ligase family protein, partial [Steroidobacteraceae bacterium]|nr:glutamate--tRNA ligase family protein [Steroidobacteraceae bacterium]
MHLGSLLAAPGSFLDARHHGGRWLLRMEDLDRPRVLAGAADDILRTLEALGLEWDGPVLYQSTRSEHYEAA